MVQPQRIPIASDAELPDGTPVTQDSGANAINTLAVAAVTGVAHHITAFSVVIGGAATGNAVNVVIKDGTTVVWKEIIATAAPIGTTISKIFMNPIEGTVGNAVSIVVDAGGASCVTTANLEYYDL